MLLASYSYCSHWDKRGAKDPFSLLWVYTDQQVRLPMKPKLDVLLIPRSSQYWQQIINYVDACRLREKQIDFVPYQNEINKKYSLHYYGNMMVNRLMTGEWANFLQDRHDWKVSLHQRSSVIINSHYLRLNNMTHATEWWNY